MHLQLAASAAVLACAGNVMARAEPYKLAMMAVPGMSLVRRDTSGYQPEQQRCGAGDTCAQACGETFLQCPADDVAIHCYDPAIGQNCCTDGNGNSCDEGFYCSHDTDMQTWCCPEDLSLEECAAAYKVTGGLETPTAEATTSTTVKSTTVISTTVETTTAEPTTTEVTSTWVPASSGSSTAWTGSNSTYTSASLSSSAPVSLITEEPSATEPGPSTVPENGASSAGISMLLLAAAGVVALL